MSLRRRNRILIAVALVAAVATASLIASRFVTPATSPRADESPRAEGSLLAPGGASLPFGPGTFREIAEAQMPMVVNIRTELRRQTRDLSEFFDGQNLFERFFGLPRSAPRDQITHGAGSGFIIEGGLILTNSHVVSGATKITVALYAGEQGEEFEARVIGRDPLTDSALIELTEKPSQDLPVAKLGSSEAVKPGDWVMAIGNPFNLAHTVTVGVISAIDRPFPVSEGHWQDVLQTDAAINPGNSGGPLLNLRGEVVGINTAIFTSGPQVGNVGVGFAIPIDAVRELLPELRTGTITRGRIGVQITPVTKSLVEPLGLERADGALVRLVDEGGPAAEAGIEPGDVIVGYNGKPVGETGELVEMVSRTKPGTTVPVEIVRDGERRTLRVRVASLDIDEGTRLDIDEGTSQTRAPAETGFGMSLSDLTPQLRAQLRVPAGRSGAVVTSVEQGGLAARAGIRGGDVLLEVNRTAVKSASDAAAALQRMQQGDTAFALIWRQGQELFVTMARE